MTSEGSSARASAERPCPSNSGISPNRSPRSMSATTDSRPSTDLLAMAMRPSTHDEELVGLVAFVEQDVVALQLTLDRRRRDGDERFGREVGEELDVGEQIGGNHERSG